MLHYLRNKTKNNYYIHKLYLKYLDFKKRCHNRNNLIKSNGGGKILKDIIGSDNEIVIEEGAYLNAVKINIRGNNNRIYLGSNVRVGERCSFYIQGNNISITIGKGSTFTQTCHFNAQEDGRSIIVGDDCMFSNQIIVRTSDSHPIYSLETKERINNSKDVVIGNHVWIAPNSVIMKGACIGDGCIVGSRTMVSKTIPSNCLAVGTPARIVKENVYWTRENLFNFSF